MRTFILVLCLGIVSTFNVAGIGGVIAWLLCMGAFAVGCFWGWLQTLANTSQANPDNDAGDACDNDDDNDGLTTEEEQVLLFWGLIALIDPYTTEPGAVEYSLCSQAYGACTTTPADTDGDNA